MFDLQSQTTPPPLSIDVLHARYRGGDSPMSVLTEIEEQIATAVRVVEPIAPPALGTMMEDVYATPPWHLREQLTEMESHPAPPSGHGGGH